MALHNIEVGHKQHRWCHYYKRTSPQPNNATNTSTWSRVEGDRFELSQPPSQRHLGEATASIDATTYQNVSSFGQEYVDTEHRPGEPTHTRAKTAASARHATQLAINAAMHHTFVLQEQEKVLRRVGEAQVQDMYTTSQVMKNTIALLKQDVAPALAVLEDMRKRRGVVVVVVVLLYCASLMFHLSLCVYL